MNATLAMIGTRKGLWIGNSDDARRRWSWAAPLFAMQEIYSVAILPGSAGTRLLVGATSPHWGPQVYRSDDGGDSWQETAGGAICFPEDTGTSLERVWQMQAAPAEGPDVVYAGTEPSALFRSQDRGETFELVRGLWDHPHRPTWYPGGGGQAIHTILPHPARADDMTVAMSTGGVYRSQDAGTSWAPYNKGIGADFIPGESLEYGQCVHKVARDAANPDRLYAQNHGGLYRSDDAGRSWTSIADGLPGDFGFPVVADPRRGDTLYVFPLVADIERFPPDARPLVWRSADAGDSWVSSGDGLPAQAHTSVLRDAFSHDGSCGLYIGTRHGALWISNDSGEQWHEVLQNLPDVLCVRAARA